MKIYQVLFLFAVASMGGIRTTGSTPTPGTTTTTGSTTTPGTTTTTGSTTTTMPSGSTNATILIPIYFNELSNCEAYFDGECMDPNSAEGLNCTSDKGWYSEGQGCEPDTWKCCMHQDIADAKCLAQKRGKWECKEECENGEDELEGMCEGTSKTCCKVGP